jgi:hypothetical protein
MTLSKQAGEFRLKYAEFVAPGVSHYPEVVATLLLVIPASCTELFEATHFGFNIVGFEIEVHPFLAAFGVSGELEQHTYLGIREAEAAVDLAALRVDRFLRGFEDR